MGPHSYNRITEKPVPSIGKGTANLGVGSSEPTRQRVGGGDAPLQTPLTSVPNYSDHLYVSPQRFIPGTRAHRLLAPPLGAESADPPSPVAPTPKAGVTPSVSEASPSPSLEGGTPNTHTGVLGAQEEKKIHRFLLEASINFFLWITPTVPPTTYFML